MRSGTNLRASAAAFFSTLAIVTVPALTAWWLPAGDTFTRPSAMMAIAAVTLAGAITALLAWSAGPASGQQAGPLRQRAVALRRKAWSAVFQRQLNPDAAGHARPRAPSAAPAAA